MDLEKDSNREAFEAWFESRYDANFMQFALDVDFYVDKHTQTCWEAWQAAKAQEAEKLKGCVVVPKGQTEDWYLDPDEHIWYEQDGIDYALSYMDIGEVTAIEHKEYLITESDTLYAAIVWDDSNDQVGFWGFFKTEEEAEKAAAHCKAMREAAQEQAND